MEHIALTIFSTSLQASIGIMLFVAIGRLINSSGIYKNATIAAAGLGIIGMLASVLHLGQPMKAFMALYQFGSSWLSREIWLTAIFVGLVVLAVLLLLFKAENKGAITGTIVLAAIAGLVDIFFMGAIYTNTSVPFWQNSTTYIEFFAATISMGGIIFLFLSLQEAAAFKKLIAIAVAAAIVMQVAAVIPNLINLSVSSSTATQSSLTILSSLSTAGVLQWLFILIGAILVVWIAKDELSPSVGSLTLASATLLFIGQGIGRYLFYAAMIVTGIGLS